MTNFLRTDDPDIGRTVMVALQKGGTGKTTFAAGVAYEAARLGAKVLLIDLDPNWGLTGEHLGYDPAPAGDRVIGDLITDGGVGTAGSAILTAPRAWGLRYDLPWDQGGTLTADGALGFIPGYPTLLNAVEASMSKPAAEMRLRNALKNVARHFDLVVIDTGPRADRIAWLGMQAAGTVVGLVIPEDGAAKGLTEELEFVEGYAGAWDLPIRFAGAVCTKFDNRNRAAHGRGLERIQASMRDWPETVTTTRAVIPGRAGLVPDSAVGAIVWDEVIPQSTYVLHGQMERLPVAYGLWPDPNLAPFRQAQTQQKAAKAIAPYTRAALRLLHLVSAPCLDQIDDTLAPEESHLIWGGDDETQRLQDEIPNTPHTPKEMTA